MSSIEASVLTKKEPLEVQLKSPSDVNLAAITNNGNSPPEKIGSAATQAAPTFLPELTLVQAPGVDRDKFIEAMAATIRKATKRDQFIDTGTDEKAIMVTLRDLSEADRKAVSDFYLKRYGITLKNELKGELSGADLANAEGLLDRKDGSNGDAVYIHSLLTEANQWVMGRSKSNIASVIRDKVITQNAADITNLDNEYKQLYGKGLQQALLEDVRFDKYSKEMIPILMKGADRITTAEHLKLADIALRAKNVEMFQQVMTNISPEARTAFEKAGGEARVNATFGGHWYNALTIGLSGNVSDLDLRHAKDYMKDGHLSAANKLRDNSSWIGDNEKAIEDALKNISSEERKSYQSAREALQSGKTPELADRKVYDELQMRIKAAGNSTERAAWEAMILYPGSKLGKDLMTHDHIFIDSSIGKVVATIEQINKDDWQRLKTDPNFRKDMEAILRGFLSKSEMARVKDSFDKLQACNSFEDIQTSGSRSIENSIKDNKGIFTDEQAIVDALSKLSPKEQERYRTDSEFRKNLDKMVASALGTGAEGDAGKAILKRVLNNESPALSVIDKINMESVHFNVDEGKVIRNLEQALRENPDMRRMANEPKDANEKEFAKNLMTALHRALDPYEFNRYAKPLLEKGSLDLNVQNELNDWFLHNDRKGIVENIVTVDEAQRNLLLSTDKNNTRAMALQKEVFGTLNEPTAQFAKVVLRQRAYGPEDRIRSFILGVGSTKDDVLGMMGQLSSEQKKEIFDRYATKYGGSLTADVIDKLKKQDRDLGELVARNHTLNADEQLNLILDAHSKSRQGVGKYMVDNLWDGTGFQSDEARNLMVQAMRKASIAGTDLDPNASMTYARRSLETVGIFRESKAKVGEVATDIAITAAAIGGAFFTAGGSLSLLAKTALAGSIGAAIKIGGKSTVSGSDYDWSTRQVALDGGVGFVYGATTFLGSQALAKALNVGGAAGTQAAQLAQASMARMASGGSTMVVEGSEQVIQDGMTAIARTMLLKGTEKIPMNAVALLANQVATQGNQEAVKLALQVSLAQSLKQNAMSTGAKLAIEFGLPTAAGSMSGGTAGTIRGAAEWNPDLTVDENLENIAKQAGTSALIGAGSAFVFKLGTKAVAIGYDAITADGADQVVNNPDAYINDRADDVGIFKKKPVVLKAIQATQPTTIQTLEGPVQANQGDWIMTGVKGEQWPVRPEVFARSYDAVPGAQDMFQKKQIQIMAVQIEQAMDLLDASGKVKYQGSPGDWLVIGLNGDKYFVKPDVFALTYGPVDQVAQRTAASAEAAAAAAARVAAEAAAVTPVVPGEAPEIMRAETFLQQRSGDLTTFRKAPVELKAVQATEAQVIQTWEGPVKAEPGDWIMTGVKGEQWPIKPSMFVKYYQATNIPGVFRKRPIEVQAIQIESAMQIFDEGQLKFTGKPTDWLVIDLQGKPYFVDNEVFLKTFNSVVANK